MLSLVEVLLIGLGVVYLGWVWKFAINTGKLWFLPVGLAYLLAMTSLSGRISQNVVGWANIGVFVLGIYLPVLWNALDETYGIKSKT